MAHECRKTSLLDPATLAVPVRVLAAGASQVADASGNSSVLDETTQVAGLTPASGCLLPEGCVRYVAPSTGGWGIVRGALAVPESVLLFVAPQACGRHGSVASVIGGYRNRLFYLDASESELVMGAHIERVEEMVDRIFKMLPTPPRAFFICATCVDDLLGSDFPGLCAQLSERYGIPFADAHMDPISKSSSAPPVLKLQRSIYGLLCAAGPATTDQESVNVLGSFVPVDAESELYGVLARAGFPTVRQLPSCSTYDEYLQMRTSVKNILIKPFGRLACKDMKRVLGIPYQFVRMRYMPDAVAEQYDVLSSFLGVSLDVSEARAACEAHLEEARGWLSGISIGVGANLNGSSFEIAALLASFGAHVRFVIADEVTPAERPFVDELARTDGQMPVYPATHPGLSLVRELPERVDVAIGFDAAKLSPGSRLMLLDSEVQPFGFETARYLVDGVRDAIEHPRSAKDLLYSKGLVV